MPLYQIQRLSETTFAVVFKEFLIFCANIVVLPSGLGGMPATCVYGIIICKTIVGPATNVRINDESYGVVPRRINRTEENVGYKND